MKSNRLNYTSKKYYEEINIARGIGMLYVILGHAFINCTNDLPDNNAFYKLIFNSCYSFHMGLFFFIAGFVASYKLTVENINLKELIRSKFRRLIVPYLFFSALVFAIKMAIPAMADNAFTIKDSWKILVGTSPHGGVWFLWDLFVVSIIYAVISKITKGNMAFMLITGGAFYIVFCFTDIKLASIYNLLRFTSFYALGILANRNYDTVRKILDGRAYKTVLLYSFIIIFNIFYPRTQYKNLYLITGVIGAAATLNLSIAISKKRESAVYKWTNEFGNYSYDMYLISYFVILGARVILYSKLGLSYLLIILFIAVPGTFISYAVSKYIVRKSKILSRLMVGI